MRVLFVCTANLCRSPLAEHIFRRLVEERGLAGVEVESAGLFANPGQATLPAVLRASAARGLDLSQHRARLFDPAAVETRDLVYVMEENQRRQLVALARIDPRSVRLLGRLAGDGSDEIEDPVGGPDEAYDRCVARLWTCLERLVVWLEEERISRS